MEKNLQIFWKQFFSEHLASCYLKMYLKKYSRESGEEFVFSDDTAWQPSYQYDMRLIIIAFPRFLDLFLLQKGRFNKNI